MLKFIGSLIVVEDIARSRQFYEQVLGQRVIADFGENVTFEGGHSIHLKAHYQGLLGNKDKYPILKKPHNVELYFESDDVESFCQRLEGAGVEFLHGVVEQPWGQRVMRIYDPDGHVLEIGETLETLVRRLHAQGLPLEAIMQKTSLPREFVEQALSNS